MTGTELGNTIVSALVLVAVVILGLADVVGAEVVTLAIGSVLPSPTRSLAGRARDAVAARRNRPLRADEGS